MQRARDARAKDSQILRRARKAAGFRFALGRSGTIHTKNGVRSLCGVYSSVKMYEKRLLSGKRGVRCKLCKELEKQKLRELLGQEVKNYWLMPEWVAPVVEENLSFGLFGEEDEYASQG